MSITLGPATGRVKVANNIYSFRIYEIYYNGFETY